MNKEEIIKKYVPSRISVKAQGKMLLFEVGKEQVSEVCKGLWIKHRLPLLTMTAVDEREENGSFRIFYVFGLPQEQYFLAPYISLKKSEDFPSLVRDIHAVSWYEREIKTFFGLNPAGHYYPERIILHENWPSGTFPLRKDFNWKNRPKDAHEPSHSFTRVEGEGIYEIPVGPVHAGIIEPGHFRFSVAGEEIILLEPLLGYKHKGSEKLFEVLPLEKKVALAERISGDSSFNHSLAFCEAMESLADITVPERVKYLRVIYAEMERLANHFNDIGFIMLDTGFGFGGSSGARLREMIMRLNEKLTGSRFLRGVNKIGGVAKDIAPSLKRQLSQDLKKIETDFTEVMRISENVGSLINRLKGTGVMDPEAARDHGICGVAARAMGMIMDARVDFPYAAYDKLKVGMPTEEAGDVYARYTVRVNEVYASFKILHQALSKMPEGDIGIGGEFKFKNNAYALGVTEGWRGNIVYFVATDAKGRVSRVMPRDPSFLNWAAFPYSVKGNVIPDFPLINKSFNLSYSGYDR